MSVYRTDDPHADFDRWDAERTQQEENLPECSECGSKIYEEFYYEFEGEPICDECMYNNHRKNIEYFM